MSMTAGEGRTLLEMLGADLIEGGWLDGWMDGSMAA